jgi:hypothetical protein
MTNLRQWDLGKLSSDKNGVAPPHSFSVVNDEAVSAQPQHLKDLKIAGLL